MKLPSASAGVVAPAVVELLPDMVESVLNLIVLAWDDVVVLPEVHAASLEVPVTERLRDKLRIQVGRCPWGKGMLIVSDGTESMSAPGLPEPDGVTDIPLFHIAIYQRDNDHTPHMIVECKRIAGANTGLCRSYVVEGMDRFIKGKYGARHRAGFMVGYVQGGTSAESADGVNKYLTKKSRAKDHLAPSTRPEAWESNHSRPNGMPTIHLRHALLKTSLAPAPAAVAATTAAA